jgi:hypothetical protein
VRLLSRPGHKAPDLPAGAEAFGLSWYGCGNEVVGDLWIIAMDSCRRLIPSRAGNGKVSKWHVLPVQWLCTGSELKQNNFGDLRGSQT